MTYTVTLSAESKAELASKISDLHAEWLGEPDKAATTPHKLEGNSLEGSVKQSDKNQQKSKAKKDPTPSDKPAEEQPDLPLEEPAEEPDAGEPTPVTVDALRKQLMAYAEANGNTKARELVSEWGKVSDVPEEERNAVYLAAGGEL